MLDTPGDPRPWMRARTLPCGWHILPMDPHPLDYTTGNGGRERMALVRPDRSEFAMVWRSHWRPALRAAVRGEPIPGFMRAPVYTWAADEAHP